MNIPIQGQLAVILQRLQPILTAIEHAGGHALIVGGAVRDYLFGHDLQDVDIEVYGLSAEQITRVLSDFGRVYAVGRSFGVLKFRFADGEELDFAMPRRENKTGAGHRGFMVEPDPHMTPREAAMRRDFTWNAMALTLSGELLDFFYGAEDLQAGVIRHVSDAFAEDPLRVLRAMQFAARFDMHLAPETAILCRSLRSEAATLSIERIWGEWHKWALKGQRPSAGLRVLYETGWIAVFPELQALVGCLQNAKYHPEGDVWIHTQFVCDAAAQIAIRENLGEQERMVLLFSALCHDLGKPCTTGPDAEGRMRSPGHAKAGVPLVQSFLQRIGAPKQIIAQVERLVHRHMAHLRLQITEAAVRRLAVQLKPATIRMWAHVLEADYSGRPPFPPGKPGTPVVEMAEQLGVVDGPPKPLLLGRHLLEAGVATGPGIGALLDQAYEAQIDGNILTTDEALIWVLQHVDKDGGIGE
ncbi:MAG: tRNA nucleotidyltransferase [Chloroflexi bacterium AL-W]|nr:tRNA nucleotidyltransferase [Chloroflexi bacterium AL-N1]NOK67072.1 tRNA nucleotidyltransferase [Chloroflexi bacterium AL-N10]NOK74636.1 tRNA nucleotidyltransferase [Chloroflexi bacterium AL-N5]NOK81674.1 tRNA nucleotidyltransferase [Chloroflexi bacterium AL-W]NOK89144.1 tRNA nucleotidyltransferase [Chloroflexi bacterium AL-N15]